MKRGIRLLSDVLAGVALAALWVWAALVFIAISVGVLFASEPFNGWIALAGICSIPVIASAATRQVSRRPKLRWVWLTAGAAAATAVAVAMPRLVGETHWPRAKPIEVVATCPRPLVSSGWKTVVEFPISAEAYDLRGKGMAGGGGVPDGFVPVRAMRCVAVIAAVATTTAEPEVGVRTESAAGADFTALLQALRRPAEVWNGHTCPAGNTEGQARPYLVLIDTHGRALLAGFPTDGCGIPHQDALAAFDALPWTAA